MYLRRFGSLLTPVVVASYWLACPTLGQAVAGGHHHKMVIAVPVQTTMVQTTQVQAAAPVMFLTTTVAASPISFVPAPAPVAAAPMYLIPMTVATPLTATRPAAAAPVAGAPPAGTSIQVMYNGVLTKFVSANPAAAAPSVGASPSDDDGISDETRAGIITKLKSYVAIYTKASLEAETLRTVIRTRAVDLYGAEPGVDADSAAGTKAINSMVAEALGTAPEAAKPDPIPSATQTPTQTQTQQILVPVAAPAPLQLFLPVKVKYHQGHSLFH